MQKKFSKRRLVNRFILLCNIGAAVALFISQFSPSLSPVKFWPAEFLALTYPFLLLLNIVFIIYWIIVRIRLAIISLIVILSGFNVFSSFYQINFNGEKNNSKDDIEVMSYNVRLFDLYNWTGNLKTRSKIFDQLKSSHPDIICFQEFYNSDEGNFRNTQLLMKLLPGYKAHVEYGITLRKVDHWGLATFTRYPVVGKGRVIYEKGKTNFGLYTDVKIDDDTVRIYNIHLQSNHFKEKDYRFIESPDSGSNEQIVNASRSIIRRLKSGAIKRAKQVDELNLHIGSSPHPVIICGDFNDPPFSYAYKKLAGGRKDSFKEKGSGTASTYAGKIPFFRIDFILHDDAFECTQHNVITSKWSDHHPVIASFVKSGKN